MGQALPPGNSWQAKAPAPPYCADTRIGCSNLNVRTVSAGTFFGPVVVDKDLVVSGAGPELTILDARNVGTVVTVATNANVTLSGILPHR